MSQAARSYERSEPSWPQKLQSLPPSSRRSERTTARGVLVLRTTWPNAKSTGKITEKQDVSHWAAWEADSLSDAQDIEKYFINKGMKGGTGGNLDSRYKTYVYIF
jgi:hypothetical protein